MQKKKNTGKGANNRPPLPANHNWVPVNQWKISQLKWVSCPPNQIKLSLRLMTVRPVKEQYLSGESFQSSLPQKPRLSSQKIQKTHTHESILTHLASIHQLENLQHRFMNMFTQLDKTQQQTLIDYFLIQNVGVWAFENADQTAFLDAREYLETDLLTPERTERFDAVIERLTQILAQSHEDENGAGFDTIDSVFGYDSDSEKWAQDNRLMYRILETLIIELTDSLEQSPTHSERFSDLRQ